MSKFRSVLLASTIAVVPAVVFAVPVTAAAQEAGAKPEAAQEAGTKPEAAKKEAAKPEAAKPEAGAVREIEVVVDRGYKPARIEATEGERVRLKFIRREYTPCTREVVIPSLNIRQELPPNKPVVVELPPLKAGEVEYRCGMNMVRGTLVVNPAKS